jgi:putative oxygen-independent coproporphyrinogen III oxidase
MLLTLPPLALYIHFPWCIRKCPYCDFNSHALKNTLPEKAYLQALLTDLSQELPHIGDRALTSVYCGGGTPNLFSPEIIQQLLTTIQSSCHLIPDIEITLEANPGVADEERFAAYHAAGVNRLSIGVQSFQDAALQRLGRIHQGAAARKAVDAAKAAGFKNINLDLMHGLPQQTIAEGLDDLSQAIQLAPTHLSWYQLTLEPNTAFAHHPPPLPKDEVVWDLQDHGMRRLAQAEFTQYEISAFSKPGFICRHNRNCWQFGDYIGIGAGAHSKLSHIESQTITRHWKHKHPKTWLSPQTSFIDGIEPINPKQLPFEFMLNALRLYQPIERTLFEQRTGLAFSTLEKSLTQAAEKGLLIWTSQTITPTDLGRRFYNDLVSLFSE